MSAKDSVQRGGAALGEKLREYRLRQEVTGSELAQRAGVSQGTLSKIEQGKLLPSIDLICRLGAELQVPLPEIEEWLVQHGIIPSGVPLPYEFLRADDVERFQRMLEVLERKASMLRMYQSQIIPGQLQTEAYAVAVMRLVRVMSPEMEKRAVNARLRRRALIESGKPCIFVLTEEALRARVCSGRDLAEQFEFLKTAASLPNVRLGVIPWTTRLTARRPPSFYIYDSHLVHVELPHDHFRLTRRQDITVYEELFAAQLRMAVAGQECLRIIERIRDDHQRLDDIEASSITRL